eukprot:m.153720 g.153720  ORF g.153720 m.153720 type:complete len:68 (+) comp14295_c0_seq10:10868-11071(+)
MHVRLDADLSLLVTFESVAGFDSLALNVRCRAFEMEVELETLCLTVRTQPRLRSAMCLNLCSSSLSR